jgi:hypothetical protein
MHGFSGALIRGLTRLQEWRNAGFRVNDICTLMELIEFFERVGGL